MCFQKTDSFSKDPFPKAIFSKLQQIILNLVTYKNCRTILVNIEKGFLNLGFLKLGISIFLAKKCLIFVLQV